MYRTLISAFLFFILTPGILFQISKSKWGAMIHGIIFAILICYLYKNDTESLTMFTDTSCNNIVQNTQVAMRKNIYFKDASSCRGPFLFESVS